MLPAVIEEAPIDECDHIKIYDEQAMNEKKPAFKWKCGRCAEKGVENKIEFIHTYDQIKVLKL